MIYLYAAVGAWLVYRLFTAKDKSFVIAGLVFGLIVGIFS